MKHRYILAGALAAFAALPAAADTVDVMMTRGFFVGQSIGQSVAYTPLGGDRVRMTQTVDRQMEGTWRKVDPTKLCISAGGQEMCFIVPADKVSKDTFEAQAEGGPKLNIILN